MAEDSGSRLVTLIDAHEGELLSGWAERLKGTGAGRIREAELQAQAIRLPQGVQKQLPPLRGAKGGAVRHLAVFALVGAAVEFVESALAQDVARDPHGINPEPAVRFGGQEVELQRGVLVRIC